MNINIFILLFLDHLFLNTVLTFNVTTVYFVYYMLPVYACSAEDSLQSLKVGPNHGFNSISRPDQKSRFRLLFIFIIKVLVLQQDAGNLL